MILNSVIAEGGSLLVEILDSQDEPIPGFTLADADRFTGDSVRHTVQWRGNADVSRLAGSDTRRHFELRGTRLYAFQFETDPEEATT